MGAAVLIAADGFLPQADGAGGALGACFTASAAVALEAAGGLSPFAPSFAGGAFLSPPGAADLADAAAAGLAPLPGCHALAVAWSVA